MKDFFIKLLGNLFFVFYFLIMVVPMIIVLLHFGIRGIIATIISLAYYYFFKSIPFVKPIVLIASFIFVFIDFPLKAAIIYCCIFAVCTLIVFSPWVVALVDKGNKEK